MEAYSFPYIPTSTSDTLRDSERPFTTRTEGTGSVEWEWLPILKQSLIQTPVQFSRDLYVAEMPGRMGICMPYVVYPINSSRVLVRELFGFDHRVGHFWPLSIMGVVPKLPCPQ